MKTIHKIQLTMNRRTEVLLPKEFKVLKIDMQEDHPVMWIEFDSGYRVKEKESIYLYCTGEQDIPDNRKYLGTFQTQVERCGGDYELWDNFVGHIYLEVK